MRKVLGCGVVMALLLLLASPVPSEARGHVFFRFDIPLWVGPGYWGQAHGGDRPLSITIRPHP